MTSVARHLIVTVAASAALGGCANCSLDALRDWAEPRRSETRVSAVERHSEQKTEHAAVPAAAPVAVPAAPATEQAPAQAAVDPATEKRKWCDQRFIDYQDGKRPGGAATVAQKEADDRECAIVRQGEQQIETGTIPAR